MKKNKDINSSMQLLTPTMLYSDLEKRYRELVRMKQEVEGRLQSAPAGKIHIVNSANRVQFYLRTDSSDKSGKYIKRSDEETVRTYLQKAYDEKALKYLNREIDQLRTFLNRSVNCTGISTDKGLRIGSDTSSSIGSNIGSDTSPSIAPNIGPDIIQEIYSNFPPIAKRYITPIDMSDEDFATAWQCKPFRGKEISEDVPVYETIRKERVRSKSELTIANKLAERGIPYKYECPLKLQNGTVIYPDFTVLIIKERREVYWEHRGMMDDREYAKNAVFKLKSMTRSGIVIGDNLIITEETSANPLGTNEIDILINRLFRKQ